MWFADVKIVFSNPLFLNTSYSDTCSMLDSYNFSPERINSGKIILERLNSVLDFDNFSLERTTNSGNSFLGRTNFFLSFSQAFQERHNFNPVFHKNALEYIRKILDPSRTDLECNSFDFNIYQEYTRSVYMAEIKAYGDATQHTGTRRIILHGNAAPRESHYHFMAPIYGNQFDLSANHESGDESRFWGFD